MTCSCKVLQNRLEIMQTKYARLKKDHLKLLGATTTLIDALEELIRTGVNNKWLDTLESCSTSYADLIKGSRIKILGISSNHKPTGHLNPNEILDENERIQDATTESEREYNEGFLARPRIPRTPLHH